MRARIVTSAGRRAAITNEVTVTTEPRVRSTSAPAAPPRRPTLASALFALALGGFAIGTTEFVAMGLLPQITAGVGISLAGGSHLISAYALGVVVGAPLLAALAARFPRRRVLIVLMLAYAAANGLSALAPTYGLLVAGRFLSGLPHGAYFGVASLVAADLAGPERRARAVARVLLGLSVANVLGVPLATWLGQTFGWRAAFAAGGVLALVTAAAVVRFVPWTPANHEATMRRELAALRRPQVWLAFATGAIGGGGMFAVYSYITPILTDRAGLALAAVPLALALLGIGMVAGGLLGGRLMDWRPIPSTFGAFLAMAGIFALFTVSSLHPLTALATVFLIGTSLMLPTGLQMRLMDVSRDAQTLGAALNHSAFNVANALGAWLGGLVLAAGLGLAAPMWVAVGLTFAGLGVFALAVRLERR
jgi:DHA1 family inner membrane transport protein